uniref:Protein RALF-like 32 n=1 Tax=Noccaea caerulescens TaxID=107243 RepID=A0A1J3D3C9_NOCCA
METKPSKIFFTISIILVCLLAHVTSKTSSSSTTSLCNDSVAECSSVGESEEVTVIMESWSSQRLMEEQHRRLSYGTLRRNQPACDGGNPGESYTNKCLPPPSNPYSRGCSKHYRCARDT